MTRNGECAYLAEGALDDGVGPVAAGPGAAAGTPNELARAHHFGVVQMHQWAELAGGRLEIAPREPGGTEVRLVVSGR